MDKTEIGFLAGLAGLLAGMSIMLVADMAFPPLDINRIKVFQRENKPEVMRLCRNGRDGVYVADSNNKQEYIKQDQYLATIENPADREIEKALIRKTVGWYE